MQATCRFLSTMLVGVLLAGGIVWGLSLSVDCAAPQAAAAGGGQSLAARVAIQGFERMLRGSACAEAVSVRQLQQLFARDPQDARIWSAAGGTVFVLLLAGSAAGSRRRPAPAGAGPFRAKGPRILVSSIESAKPAAEDEPLAVVLTFRNTGQTKAYVTGIGAKLLHRRHPLEPGLAFQAQPLKRIRVRRGQDLRRLVSSDSPFVRQAATAPQKFGRDYRVFCVGYIAYADRRGLAQRTGFCRWYEPASGEWMKDGESEYEYAR